MERKELTKREEKRRIRKMVLEARDAFTEEERKAASIRLTDRIIGHQWFYRACVLLGFVGFGSEVDTRELLTEALQKGKKVYVPRVEGEDMYFYRINSLQELTPGYKGILEPDGTGEKYDYLKQEEEKTLLLMPGVAFDLYGNRLGYGKGYYDRFLADKEMLRTYSIAIGFACQRVESLPVEATDIKPYQVILL